MTEMAPEAPLPVPIELRAEVEVVSHIDVTIIGPAGLTATVHIPDADEALDELDTFAGSLHEAIRAALADAERRAEEAERA